MTFEAGGMLPRKLDAPFIFIGKVRSCRMVGTPFGDGYQTVEAVVVVENEIRGHFDTRRVKIYYRVPIIGYTGGTSLLSVGRRYVLLADLEQGVLRSLADPWVTAVPIPSGRHETVPEGAGLRERLWKLSMTPGEDLDPTAFAASLRFTIRVEGGGDWNHVQALRKLTRNEHVQVRLAACSALARHWGQDDCWETLDVGDAADLGFLRPVRLSIENERGMRRVTRDPHRWWNSFQHFTLRPDAEGDLFDRVRLLATHKDPTVARKYCQLLNEKYPTVSVRGCPASIE